VKIIRKLQKSIIGLLTLLVLVITPSPTFANDDVKVMVNGNEVIFSEPVFIENNRVYIPIRFVAEEMRARVDWNDENKTVTIDAAVGETFTFTINSDKMILNGQEFYMDVPPIIRNQRTYLPVRHIAELMHSYVSWDSENSAAKLESMPIYFIQSGDTLDQIATKYGVTIDQLKARNGLKENEIQAGATLKIIIPQFIKAQQELIKKNQEHPDLNLLARLIEAEAEGESLTGKVAVGSVILNRAEDDRFPDTIKEVIYQENQFTPVKNGRLNAVTPSEESFAAAKQAIAGEKPVSNALFFFNPSLTNDTFLHSKQVLAKIGNHEFLK
jgi:N-acetylmuramoyl-L-alanine amidase